MYGIPFRACLYMYMQGATEKGFGKYSVFNLGTGKGYSVLDMLTAMGKVRIHT
jgi:UDP-glucose 4-epimerase